MLAEVISATPAMWPSWRSSGAATDEAIISGLAPGNAPCTEMVGISTCGNGDTGNNPNADNPANATPIVSNVVAIGRRMKGAERLATLMALRFLLFCEATAACLRTLNFLESQSFHSSCGGAGNFLCWCKESHQRNT